MKKQTSSGTVRIIAGEWRSRKLPVADVPGLRPTTDRLRETLFNWIQYSVIDAQCLDMFAGAGALGFEAASRGARSIVMIERDRKALLGLQASINLLKTDKVTLVQADALAWLSKSEQSFDIIFIDPPFDQNLGSKALDVLNNSNCLKSGTLIFLEEEKQAIETTIPDSMKCIKEGKAGHVRYSLLEVL